MLDILIQAGCFVAIILLGIVLRNIGFFRKEDFTLLSRIVINITLPAAIITNFAGRELETSLLFLILIGFAFGVILIVTVILLNRRRGPAAQAFAILNTAGVNISNFVLPFAQGFLGPAGVMSMSLFDIGNAMICLGGSSSIAGMILERRSRFSLLPLLRAMVRSIPLMTYITATLLCLAHITLPGPLLNLAGIIGKANPFLAMLMLGIGFQLQRDRLPEVIRVLLPRYLTGLILALLCYFLLPLPLIYRQTLIIPFLGPISSSAPAFTARLNGDYELASAVNSFSILISIILIIITMTIIF